jgi:hypothetical protein
MFEATLIPILQDDTTIQEYVSEFEGDTAIFSDTAPQEADRPFAETVIFETSVGDSVVSSFTVWIDYYTRSSSGADARKFIERCIELLDRREIKDDTRYGTIRIFYQSTSRVDEGDPLDIHYRIEFTARAGRKKYTESLSTTSGA